MYIQQQDIGSTLRRGTLSPSGEIIARMSLVMTGGAPGSADGAVPNSNLKFNSQTKLIDSTLPSTPNLIKKTRLSCLHDQTYLAMASKHFLR